jgi:hypothetical protein
VIAPFELVGFFHGQDVVAFFDNAQDAIRARRMRAELARIDVGQIVAD